MSDDKPINAMIGQKIKLDLDKIKNRSNESPVESQAVEEKPVENKVSEEPVAEKVAEKPVAEKVTEEAVEKKETKKDTAKMDEFTKKLAEKDKKLSNQSSELNYLTNEIIPKLKKENAHLNQLKKELTDALENTTRKYFVQLDVNADLSNQIGKLGAEGAVNKVRADKFESEISNVKEELQAKIDELKERLSSIDADSLEKENSRLAGEVSELKTKLSDARKENISLSEEVDKLRAEIIEVGNYKEEVDKKVKSEISQFKDEISSLKTQLKVKESSYDKLSNESGKTISDLRRQVRKLEDSLEKESNKGLFNRLR